VSNQRLMICGLCLQLGVQHNRAVPGPGHTFSTLAANGDIVSGSLGLPAFRSDGTRTTLQIATCGTRPEPSRSPAGRTAPSSDLALLANKNLIGLTKSAQAAAKAAGNANAAKALTAALRGLESLHAGLLDFYLDTTIQSFKIAIQAQTYLRWIGESAGLKGILAVGPQVGEPADYDLGAIKP
jgi:hypothetical protein